MATLANHNGDWGVVVRPQLLDKHLQEANMDCLSPLQFLEAWAGSSSLGLGHVGLGPRLYEYIMVWPGPASASGPWPTATMATCMIVL